MIYILQIYLLAILLFLAGKDADSYQLKDKQDNSLTGIRIRRWHRDGAALWFLSFCPCLVIYNTGWWVITIYWVLLRLSFFDVAFNNWAGLPTTYLGSTAFFDRIFSKIFGQHGALYKSFTFFLILGGLNIWFTIKHWQ